MSTEEFMEMVKRVEVTPEVIKRLKEDLRKAELQFEQEDRDMRPTVEWLNITYTL